MNKPIIMGMNTLKSLPRLLPGRKHIVLTHQEVNLDDSIMVCHNITELLNYVQTLKDETMIIGGAQIYNQLFKYADKMLLTEIDKSYDADVYFPKFDKNNWNSEVISEHQHEDVTYKHLVYTRKIK
jgi:dihydrofolate reductase